MSRIIRSSLLLGVAVLSLAACSSTKGPGEIGSKDDIVVRNRGEKAPVKEAAAAPEAAPAAKKDGEAFSSTVEQGEAAPAAEVASAEPLPDNSPAMEEAVKAKEEATAPLPSTVAESAGQPAVPAPTDAKPIDAVAPTTPVTETTTPPPAAAPAPQAAPAVIPPTPENAPALASKAGTVYPAKDYPAAQTATEVPAPTAAQTPVTPPPASSAPAQLPQGVKYPLDPNAPYSPKAVAAAAASAGTTTTPATTPAATGNPSDPATIKAAQTALKAKAGYTGAETGEIDAAFLNALIMYQSQNNLPQGGLNEATLKSLGVIQ